MGLDSVIRRLSPLYAASAALGMFRNCPRSGEDEHTLKKHPTLSCGTPDRFVPVVTRAQHVSGKNVKHLTN